MPSALRQRIAGSGYEGRDMLGMHIADTQLYREPPHAVAQAMLERLTDLMDRQEGGDGEVILVEYAVELSNTLWQVHYVDENEYYIDDEEEDPEEPRPRTTREGVLRFFTAVSAHRPVSLMFWHPSAWFAATQEFRPPTY